MQTSPEAPTDKPDQPQATEGKLPSTNESAAQSHLQADPGQAAPAPSFHKFSYHGNGADLLSIYAVNLVLNLLTVGFYRPWARAKVLRYLFGQTEFAGSRFVFHGTGKEMFQGYIKGLAILGLIVCWAVVFIVLGQREANFWFFLLGFFGFIAGIGLLVPVAVYGMLRYRLSRISWRGIHAGYRGDLWDMVGNFIGSYFLLFVTFGIYYPWLVHNLRDGIINNIRVGDIRLRYQGRGSDLFTIGLKYGAITFVLLLLLSWLIPTPTPQELQENVWALVFTIARSVVLLGGVVGIMRILQERELLLYLGDSTYVQTNNDWVKVKMELPSLPYLELMFVNVILTVLTVGIYYPWAKTRYLKFMSNAVSIPAAINLDQILQTEEPFKDATGDDLTSLLEIDWA